MPKTKQFDESIVLEKARNVFWKKGYNGTSMDELVKATGLSRSSIYDSFGDKHGLYLRALQQYQQQQKKLIVNSIPPNVSARKKIGWIFQNSIKQLLDDRQRKGCFMVNTTTELGNIDNAMNKIVNANFEAMEDLFYSLVKEGQDAGDIKKTFKPRALARNLFSSFNGLTIIGQTRPDKEVLEDIAKIALSVLD